METSESNKRNSERRDLERIAHTVADRAVEFAKEQPHVAVAAAFGIGWILANGISPRMLLVAARMGWGVVSPQKSISQQAIATLLGGVKRPGPKSRGAESSGVSAAAREG